jgi:hypothetical protein
MKNSVLEYFSSIPDKDLTKLALYDWEGLEMFCMIVTLDAQLTKENKFEPKFFC